MSESPSLHSFEDFIAQLRAVARATQHRRLLWLSGSATWCHRLAETATADVLPEDRLWVSNLTMNKGQQQIKNSECRQVLGSECSMVVYDAHAGLDADALGAVSGVVKSGGLLLLLTPPLTHWPTTPDPESHRLMTSIDNSRFIERLITRLQQAQGLYIVEEGGELPSVEVVRPLPAEGFIDPPCRTIDQQLAVAAIIKTARGHRKRPTVLLSDRGRGKSAALGIAAAQLLREGMCRITVTAPRMDATAALFEQAARLLPEAQLQRGQLNYGGATLTFIAPDELLQTHPATDLLLIDEAAAIPTPMLNALVQHYNRIVFATTVHGYEGSGRGFLLRFNETLHRTMPGGQQLRLEQPIRWAIDDPVEAAIFDALLLNATIASDAQLASLIAEQCVVETIDRDQLMHDEATLSQLFGLLVLAHYRTRPNDLRQLLDSPGLTVYVIRHGELIVGTALVADEGGLDAALSQAIYEGSRRLHGHLLPQSLAAHVGLPDAATLRYRRIMRIAIHPQRQRCGFGSALISKIVADARHHGLDAIGASFGITPELLHFWQRLAFTPIRIGLQREQSSGSHSLLVVRPLSVAGEQLHQQAHERFHLRLPSLLAEPLSDLDATLAVALMQRHEPSPPLQLSTDDWRDLHTFAHANLSLETVIVPLWQLTRHHLIAAKLPLGHQPLLVKKMLQKNSWAELCRDTGYTGKNEALKALRQVVGQLIDLYQK